VRYEPDGSQHRDAAAVARRSTDEASWAAAVQSLGVDVPEGYRVRLVEARFTTPPRGTRKEAERRGRP
jgi:hypothetical protein